MLFGDTSSSCSSWNFFKPLIKLTRIHSNTAQWLWCNCISVSCDELGLSFCCFLAAESDQYISTATQRNTSMNGLLHRVLKVSISITLLLCYISVSMSNTIKANRSAQNLFIWFLLPSHSCKPSITGINHFDHQQVDKSILYGNQYQSPLLLKVINVYLYTISTMLSPK